MKALMCKEYKEAENIALKLRIPWRERKLESVG